MHNQLEQQPNSKEIQDTSLPLGFSVTNDGVFYREPHPKDDENGVPPLFICSKLTIIGATRNASNCNWSRILHWNDSEGKDHEWIMPMSLLAGCGNEIISEFLSRGLKVSSNSKSRNLLFTYLSCSEPSNLCRTVNRLGWYKDFFVFPDVTLGKGADSERLVFQSQGGIEHELKISCSLYDWQIQVGRYCVSNSRLLFAVSVAFAASVMRLVDIESGGFQFVGLTSLGKSTLLRVAASVFGPKHYVRNWRSTSNGLEGLAALHSDFPLILDELGQANPRDVGEVIYMLSNGSGKSRANRTGGLRDAVKWVTMFLSSGEMTLREFIEGAQGKIRGGQEVRCLDIPVDAGKGLGAFEKLFDFAGPAHFSESLTKASHQYYGIAGRSFLGCVVQDIEETRLQLNAEMDNFVEYQSRRLGLKDASGEIHRALSRFGLVAAAGELATRFGITGWKNRDSVRAAECCFDAWMLKRGGQGRSDVQAGIRQVKAFLERHGNSRFQELKFDYGDQRHPIYNRAGFRDASKGCTTYFVLPEVFRSEVCAGFDSQVIAKELDKQGHLESDKDRLTKSKRVPDMGKVNFYMVLPSLFIEVEKPTKASLPDMDTA